MRNVLYLLYVLGMSKSRNEDFQISSICLVSRNEDIPMTEEINLLLCQFFAFKITQTSRNCSNLRRIGKNLRASAFQLCRPSEE